MCLIRPVLVMHTGKAGELLLPVRPAPCARRSSYTPCAGAALASGSPCFRASPRPGIPRTRRIALPPRGGAVPVYSAPEVFALLKWIVFLVMCVTKADVHSEVRLFCRICLGEVIPNKGERELGQ